MPASNSYVCYDDNYLHHMGAPLGQKCTSNGCCQRAAKYGLGLGLLNATYDKQISQCHIGNMYYSCFEPAPVPMTDDFARGVHRSDSIAPAIPEEEF